MVKTFKPLKKTGWVASVSLWIHPQRRDCFLCELKVVPNEIHDNYGNIYIPIISLFNIRLGSGCVFFIILDKINFQVNNGSIKGKRTHKCISTSIVRPDRALHFAEHFMKIEQSLQEIQSFEPFKKTIFWRTRWPPFWRSSYETKIQKC